MGLEDSKSLKIKTKYKTKSIRLTNTTNVFRPIRSPGIRQLKSFKHLSRLCKTFEITKIRMNIYLHNL